MAPRRRISDPPEEPGLGTDALPRPPGRDADGGRRRVQMIDIARMAGVSASTVSRALSGNTLIPEATRERIIELARSLNYKVNVGAANLRKRDIQTVGVVMLGDSLQTISDPFILKILGAVGDALDERDMSLLLTRLNASRKARMSAMVDSGQVAGLIVIGQLTWHEHLNELARRGVPMVVWGACLPDCIYPVVGGDNERGGYLATQHLLQRGCQRIAFFGDTTHPEVRLRHDGHVRALREAGLAVDPALEQSFLFGDRRLREVIARWLDQGLGFDGIFAAADMAAISLMGALAERGIDVPSQVKVVGYDDIELSAHVRPSLTTVHQPTDLAGRTLVDLLFQTIADGSRRTVLLPTELMVRDSTA